MAGEDPEKKFHSIMDKLFQTGPKPTPNPSTPSGVQLERGKKRLNPETALALVEPQTKRRDVVEGAPLCRPWDRGDFMRRVATFKSMTWFAKPKVVSAVNCARRGWINLDIDVIGCEACGARLLFTTPSSWTQQQVEKAASVFSLKLDNGHKLLCPWIDNACDERLAEFPPTTPAVLVEKFRERSAVLLQLLAVPFIPSSATEYMLLRSPQLQDFVGQSSAFKCGNQLDSTSYVESLGNDNDAGIANLYYQAVKLISLCGWEPRLLPYVVECNEIPKQLVKDAEIVSSSPNGHNLTVSINSNNIEESGAANEGAGTLSGVDADPNSVALDCRLCGASVGLWTFPTIARPIELFRLIGDTEFNNGKTSGQDSGRENHVDERGHVVGLVSSGVPSSTYKSSNFKLTIAGGPPPTKQNFKATISLPVIGRNLWARLSYDSHFRDCTYDNWDNSRSRSENRNLFLGVDDYAEHHFTDSHCEVRRQSNSTSNEQGQCSYSSGNQSSCLNLGSSGKGAVKQSSTPISFDGIDATGKGTSPETIMHDFIEKCPMQSTLNTAQVSDQSDGLLKIENENSQNIGTLNSQTEDFGSSLVSASFISDPDAQRKNQESNEDREQIPASRELMAYGTGKDLRQLLLDKAMGFDPVRQHRHFCPWITSTKSGTPGWQQTLSALQRQREDSHPTSPPSASMIKVNDPIASVRKLFTSPSTKRMKPNCGSS